MIYFQILKHKNGYYFIKKWPNKLLKFLNLYDESRWHKSLEECEKAIEYDLIETEVIVKEFSC